MSTLIIFNLAVVLMLLCIYYHMVRQYYVQRSIFELREAKTDLIIFLGDNYNELNDIDYKEITDLVEAVSATIERFSKIDGMRFSTVKTIMINTILSSDGLDNKSSDVLKKHKELLKNYVTGVNTSLKAIPLLKFRLLLQLFKMVLMVLAFVGFRTFKHQLRQFKRFINAEDNHFNNHHCIN